MKIRLANFFNKMKHVFIYDFYLCNTCDLSEQLEGSEEAVA